MRIPTRRSAGGIGHEFTPTIPALCVGHRALHLLFGRAPDFSVPYPATDPGDVEPKVGDLGASVAATATFDGWGGVRLLDAATLDEIDAYAIPEALDARFATGYGDLSVHGWRRTPIGASPTSRGTPEASASCASGAPACARWVTTSLPAATTSGASRCTSTRTA